MPACLNFSCKICADKSCRTAVIKIVYYVMQISNASNSPFFIHFFVITTIFSANDSFPPISVRQIPINCLFNAVGKLRLWQPTKFIMYLRRINRVSHIMPFSVSYVCNQTIWLIEIIANQTYNIYVSHFIVSAYVIYLADFSAMND